MNCLILLLNEFRLRESQQPSGWEGARFPASSDNSTSYELSE